MVIREVKILLAILSLYFLLSLATHGDPEVALFSSLHVGLILFLALVVFEVGEKRGIEKSTAIIYIFVLLLFAVVILNNLIFGGSLLSLKQLSVLGTFITATFLIFALGKLVNLQKHREFNLAFFVKYVLVVTVTFLILSVLALILKF